MSVTGMSIYHPLVGGVSAARRKGRKGGIAYPTIGRDAERLGVSRPHLWMVLEGRRASESLMRRYAALKRMKEA
jgi:hypothetical protein